MTDCGHDHVDAPGLHGHGLDAALHAAHRRCEGQGQRLTPPRRRVLELLLRAGVPVKAYDLMTLFGGEGADAAKPPTVYRALDFLERGGLVHKIASLNAYIACTLGEEVHAAGFLICDCCGATREFGRMPADWAREAAAEAGYALERITIEAHGRCGDCRSA
jgi:Fur family zinc uptake transcriptional regulator